MDRRTFWSTNTYDIHQSLANYFSLFTELYLISFSSFFLLCSKKIAGKCHNKQQHIQDKSYRVFFCTEPMQMSFVCPILLNWHTYDFSVKNSSVQNQARSHKIVKLGWCYYGNIIFILLFSIWEIIITVIVLIHFISICGKTEDNSCYLRYLGSSFFSWCEGFRTTFISLSLNIPSQVLKLEALKSWLQHVECYLYTDI